MFYQHYALTQPVQAESNKEHYYFWFLFKQTIFLDDSILVTDVKFIQDKIKYAEIHWKYTE